MRELMSLCGVGLLLAAGPCQAKQSVEKVTQGAKEVFIQKLPGVKGALPADYRATDTKYFLHIPEPYDLQRAYPLVLAISPGNEGRMMFGGWSEAAKKHGLLFACPDDAGNEIGVEVRGQRVLDTLEDVRAKYKVDAEQIYVTGFSGGGRMSTALVMALPGVFAGHIPVGGVYFTQPEGRLAELKTKLGHYLFAGEKDMNLQETQRGHQALKAAGLPVEIMIGGGQKHEPFSAAQGLIIYEWFLARQAEKKKTAAPPEPKKPAPVAVPIAAPPADTPPATAKPRTPPSPPSPADEARLIFQRAENLRRNELRQEARGLFEEVMRRFPQTTWAQRASERLAEMGP